jgi:hypothetical protein
LGRSDREYSRRERAALASSTSIEARRSNRSDREGEKQSKKKRIRLARPGAEAVCPQATPLDRGRGPAPLRFFRAWPLARAGLASPRRLKRYCHSGPAHLAPHARLAIAQRPASPRSTTDKLRGRAPCPARCWFFFSALLLRARPRTIIAVSCVCFASVCTGFLQIFVTDY